VKERPILFQGAMVRALLAGTKTQTRRTVKPQFGPDAEPEEMCATSSEGWQMAGHSGRWWDVCEADDQRAIRCPYGQPGDRLWVRETWRYREIGEGKHRELGAYVYRSTENVDGFVEPWKPSIHMPRAASRILLEVTGVRVERLQAISDADAAAEGCPCYVCGRTMDGRSEDDCHCFHRKADARDYRDLWESINGDGSWDANPWVWVVEFRRVQP
jgi:hypothetical protein